MGAMVKTFTIRFQFCLRNTRAAPNNKIRGNCEDFFRQARAKRRRNPNGFQDFLNLDGGE